MRPSSDKRNNRGISIEGRKMRNLLKEGHSMKYGMTTNANTKDVAEHSERKLDWLSIRKDFTEQWKMRQLLDARGAIVSSDKRRH